MMTILMIKNTFDDLQMCQSVFQMLLMMFPSPSLDDVVLSHVSRIPLSLRGSVEIL
jgi:hypothetical protein